MLPNMSDPSPENISGEKRVVHSVEHSISWGYLIAGVGALVLAYVLYQGFTDDADDDSAESGPESASVGGGDFEDIDVQGAAETAVGGLVS